MTQDLTQLMIDTLKESIKNDPPVPRKRKVHKPDAMAVGHDLNAIVTGIRSLLYKSDLYKKDETLYYALFYWIEYGERCLKDHKGESSR